MTHETANMAKAYLSPMGSTVASECLSEHMTAPNPLSYQLVTDSWRLVAEVLGLGHPRLRGQDPAPDELPPASICGGWGPHVLCGGQSGSVPPRRGLRGQDSERRQAG